jgi:hypothetical protein
MRIKKSNTQPFLISGAIVSVAVFLFLLVSVLSSKSANESSNAIPIPPPLALDKSGASIQTATSPNAISSPGLSTTTAPSAASPGIIPPPPEATQPTRPDPKALGMLLPSEINSATPQGGGYVVTTSFGANWFISQQEVEQLPESMKIRIDYGKYGAGAHGH